jgi:tRNA threonylcarbamoyladenosine biosynthesis protein TsaE
MHHPQPAQPFPPVVTVAIEATSLDSTATFAGALASVLSVGDTLLLEGTLGAGKTTLVRSLAQALGHDPRLVSSPTFVLVNHYVTPGQITLWHADAYRLSDPDELDTLGLRSALQAHESVILAIEWPDRLGDALALIPPQHLARVRLEHTGETSRRLTLAMPSSWSIRPGLAGLIALTGTALRPPAICPVTGATVVPASPWWPFSSEQARLADLGKWLSGQYVISRDLTIDDADQ